MLSMVGKILFFGRSPYLSPSTICELTHRLSVLLCQRKTSATKAHPEHFFISAKNIEEIIYFREYKLKFLFMSIRVFWLIVHIHQRHGLFRCSVRFW